MDTLGSLVDKLTIEQIRSEKMKLSDLPEELVTRVSEKVKSLQSEIDAYIYHAIRGEVALEEPKFKFYKNEKPSGNEFENVSGAISKLAEANYTLWNLEDMRRDKSLSDEKRLAVCDDVAKWNRVRNDAMDSVNKLLHNLLTNK